MSDNAGIKTAAASIEALLAMPAAFEVLRHEIVALRQEVRALRDAAPPALVPMPEAAKILGLSKWTIRRQIESGQLKAVRIGTSIRVDLASIQESLRTRR